jgi:hypothetical protein
MHYLLHNTVIFHLFCVLLQSMLSVIVCERKYAGLHGVCLTSFKLHLIIYSKQNYGYAYTNKSISSFLLVCFSHIFKSPIFYINSMHQVHVLVNLVLNLDPMHYWIWFNTKCRSNAILDFATIQCIIGLGFEKI